MVRIDIAPGVVLWREWFDRARQKDLWDAVKTGIAKAPFYRPVMPKSGALFSVEETNFGALGWISDRRGYRYEPTHPVTHEAWPAIPPSLLQLWKDVAEYPAEPECCLVNLYRAGAKMGLHQDRDEAATDAPVLSISLGDSAVFRIGGTTRKAKTQTVTLDSGDVLRFGGVARLAFHGIDRVFSGSSGLIESSGRINLTLRRVTPVGRSA